MNQPSLNLSSRAKSRDLWSYGLAGTNDETIFCVWGARASRMLVVVSRRNELLCSILCHRRRGERSRTHYTDLETRSFANSLAAYPRDFALITRAARCLRQLP